ncbi:MAG: hypothetical protein GXO90_10930 [FCB group bacterium]|nr:hypothetical protein [FCB group bacterium]
MIIRILIGLFPALLVCQSSVVWPAPPDTAKIQLSQILVSPYLESSTPDWYTKFMSMIRGKTERQFVRPMGLDVRENRIAVADPGAGGVFVIDRQTKQTRFMANPESENVPMDVAFGDQNIAVVLSPEPLIAMYDLEGNWLRTINLSGTAKRITGITFWRNRFIIVDTQGHKIIIIHPNGDILNTFGFRGKDNGAFNFPTFVAVDEKGTIYITDTMNFRVQSLSQSGAWNRSIGAHGIDAGQFNRPKGVALDDQGRIYIIDSSFDNIQIFNQEGRFLMHFSSAGHTNGALLMPTDIAVSGRDIIVSDTMNRRIQIFRMLYE